MSNDLGRLYAYWPVDGGVNRLNRDVDASYMNTEEQWAAGCVCPGARTTFCLVPLVPKVVALMGLDSSSPSATVD